jgi:hypothetical protein
MSLLRTALALALAAGGATSALANESHGWVYNGMTGPASLRAGGFEGSRFASNPNIGYRWGLIGVEAGYTSALGRFHESVGNRGANGELDLKFSGWNLGLNVNHDFSEKWSVQGRAGLFAWDAETRLTNPAGVRVSTEDSGNDWYAGASIDYAWTKRTSIGLGYARFDAGDAHLDLWGMHSEYRF